MSQSVDLGRGRAGWCVRVPLCWAHVYLPCVRQHPGRLVPVEGYSTARKTAAHLCFAHAAQHCFLCLVRAPEQGKTAGLLLASASQAQVVIRVRFCLVAGPCCQVLRRYMTTILFLLLDHTSFPLNQTALRAICDCRSHSLVVDGA